MRKNLSQVGSSFGSLSAQGEGPSGPREAHPGVKGLNIPPRFPESFAMAKKPSLPDDLGTSERVKTWWDALDSVAGSDKWTDADWAFALDTALLVHAVWADGELKWMQELRQREQALGITPAARKTSPTTEVAVEKVIETPLQRITERRIERRSLEGKSNADVRTPASRRGTSKS